MNSYKYIFWDLDGTIANTFEGVSKCLAYALEPYGIHISSPDEYLKFIGPPFRVSFPKFLGMGPEKTEEAIARYRERYTPIGVYECELFPGVMETVKQFRRDGLIQCVTTSKPESQARKALKKLEIADFFDDICGATSDGRIDTKDQVLEEAFRRLAQSHPDFNKSQVVLIGDTQFDAIGAKAVGIDSIGVSYGFGSREEQLEAGALEVFDDLADLRALLLSKPDGR